MLCPSCKKAFTYILDYPDSLYKIRCKHRGTRKEFFKWVVSKAVRRKKSYIIRLRQCPRCKVRFRTTEIPLYPLSVRKIAPRLKGINIDGNFVDIPPQYEIDKPDKGAIKKYDKTFKQEAVLNEIEMSKDYLEMYKDLDDLDPKSYDENYTFYDRNSKPFEVKKVGGRVVSLRPIGYDKDNERIDPKDIFKEDIIEDIKKDLMDMGIKPTNELINKYLKELELKPME